MNNKKRSPYDFYETPKEAINSLLNVYPLKPGLIFEPSAGRGAIVNEIRAHGYKNEIVINDIQDIVFGVRQVDKIFNHNFLAFSEEVRPQTIITNPPFSIAEAFLRKTFEISKKNNSDVVMLLRLNFLGAQKRKAFWNEFPVSKIYVLSKRPSFTGKGTDSTEYAWFIWEAADKNENKRIVVL